MVNLFTGPESYNSMPAHQPQSMAAHQVQSMPAYSPQNMKQYQPHASSPPQAPPQPKMADYQNMYYTGGVEVLYSENNDGEITIEIEPSSGLHKLVTAIDISSLYKEKRNKAIQLARRFENLYHEYLVSPLCPVIMDGNKLYFQTEAPDNGTSSWKSF